MQALAAMRAIAFILACLVGVGCGHKDSLVGGKLLPSQTEKNTGDSVARRTFVRLLVAFNSPGNGRQIGSGNADRTQMLTPRPPLVLRPLVRHFSTVPRTDAGLFMQLDDSKVDDSDDLPATGGRIQFCGEEVMAEKAHGTSDAPVQKKLRWNVDRREADRICNFNRKYAEYRGYFTTTSFEREVDRDKPTVYYDSVTGKPLFVAPIGRSLEDFIAESRRHGWPSFRDQEVVWENMRVLSGSGEAVSTTGTHLGHNLPDMSGNRYCINLVSVAGRPPEELLEESEEAEDLGAWDKIKQLFGR